MNLKRALKLLALDLSTLGRGRIPRFALSAMNIRFNPVPPDIIYPGGRSAVACISVDFDHISNGSNDLRKFEPKSDDLKLKLNRAGTRMLVDMSKRYSLPITWAICGKTAEADVASYEKISKSSAEYEIGVHTYSHLDVSSCSEGELEKDLSKWNEVVKVDRTPRTFIFPWNRTGHLEKLSRMGFTSFRGKTRIIGAPELEGSLWNIPPVFYIDTKSLGAFAVVKKFVDLCIDKRAVFHVWTHPWSLVDQEEPDLLMKDFVQPLFQYLEAKRSTGLLSISTLGDISSSMMNRVSSHSSNLTVSPVGA